MADVTTTSIKATSRCAIKLKDNYYTFEATEERAINNPDKVDIDEEWSKLFLSVNSIVDDEIGELVSEFKKSKKTN